MLLMMCYPCTKTEPPAELEELTNVYRAATKYGMERDGASGAADSRDPGQQEVFGT